MITQKNPPLIITLLSLVVFFVAVYFILNQAKKSRTIAYRELNERMAFDKKLDSFIEANDSINLVNLLKKMPQKWQDAHFKENLLSSAIIFNNLPALQLSEKYGVNVRAPVKNRKQFRNSLNVFYSSNNWLHFAVARKSKIQIIKYLIQKGVSKTQQVTCERSSDADPKITNQEACPNLGKTPLDLAIETKADSTIIQVLR